MRRLLLAALSLLPLAAQHFEGGTLFDPHVVYPDGKGMGHIGWAEVQFLLANVGLVGLLVGAVMPVGLGLDRLAVLFGLVEVAAAVVFVVLMGKTVKGG